MKARIALSIATLSAVVFSACEKVDIKQTNDNQEEGTTICFSSEKPSFDDVTKTFWNGETIYWSKGDKIRVACTVNGEWQQQTSETPRFYVSNELAENAQKASFIVNKFKIEDDETAEFKFYALYPSKYSESSLPDAPSAPVTIPSVQTPQADSFDPEADILLGESVGEYHGIPNDPVNLHWSRKVAHLNLTLKALPIPDGTEETISYVRIESDAKMVGPCTANLLTRELTPSQNATKSILLMGDNLSFGENNNINLWVCTLPFTATSLTFTVVTDKATYTKSYSNISKTFLENRRNTMGVNMADADRAGNNVFVKVTSAPASWDGDYLIVYEVDGANAKVFNGVDAGSDYVMAPISDGKINYSEGMAIITIATMEGGYSLKVNGGVNDGKYMYGTSGSNKLNFGATKNDNTIALSADGIAITSNTSILRFNTDGGETNDRFRYYKSTSTSNYPLISLYRKAAPEITIPVTSIELDKESASLTSGKTLSLTATVSPESATDSHVTWTSSDSDVASVTEEGVVTAKKAGEATITATSSDPDITASCTVTVSVPVYASLSELIESEAPTIIGRYVTVTLTDEEIQTKFPNGIFVNVGGKDVELYCSGVPDNWAVGGKVSGTVTCSWILFGTNEIWELQPENWDDITYTAPASIAVTGITIDSTLELTVGGNSTLAATVTPSNATDKTLTWSSDNTAVATVDQNGKVTAVAAGTATITAAATDGSGVKGTCAVTVTASSTPGGETVTLFTEGFGENTGSARNWNDSYKEQGGISTVYSTTAYTMTNIKQGKNTTGAILSGINQSSAGTDAVFEFGPLNVSGYTDLQLSYQWKAGSIKGTYFTKVYYKTSQSGSYTEVSTTGTGATTFVDVTASLPSAANGSSTLYLKIVFNTSNTQAIIDEVILTGKN